MAQTFSLYTWHDDQGRSTKCSFDLINLLGYRRDIELLSTKETLHIVLTSTDNGSINYAARTEVRLFVSLNKGRVEGH